MGRQLIPEEDTFLWLPRGDLKGETASEVTTTQDQAFQTKATPKKYYKQKERANAESVNNLTRQWQINDT